MVSVIANYRYSGITMSSKEVYVYSQDLISMDILFFSKIKPKILIQLTSKKVKSVLTAYDLMPQDHG